ncbi:MAG: caspase family protein [Bacteroidales bacterium]|nr:caspase family protein [Bacteroidales bacterium]
MHRFQFCITLLIALIHVFLLSSNHTDAQIISSERKSIKINNLNIENEKATDNTPPKVIIISPEITETSTYVSDEVRIDILGKVSDESGIFSLFINAEKIDAAEDGLFKISYWLKPGKNMISLVAMDNNDNISKNTFEIEFDPKKTKTADALVKVGDYYALLIGINNYSHPDILDLDNPVKDAKKLHSILVSKYTFNEDNVILIKNASRNEIINALDELSGIITPADNLLIFYAGHGWWDEKANIGYWLPADASKDSKAEWFRNSTLCDYLKEINSKHTLLIADACFAGGIFKTRKAFQDAPVAINKLYELPSRKAMTSGTLTEVPDRSAFVRFLVERLENNEEKYLSSEQLFSSFRIAVINNSDVVPQYGEIQGVGDEGGDFIFIRKEIIQK